MYMLHIYTHQSNDIRQSLASQAVPYRQKEKIGKSNKCGVLRALPCHFAITATMMEEAGPISQVTAWWQL